MGSPKKERETLEEALEEASETGKAVFIVDEVPALATKKELGAVKGQVTMLRKETESALGRILVEITELKQGMLELPELPELPDAPDPVEAFNEVAGVLEARIEEHEDGFAEFSTHLAKQTAMILGQIEELRTALANLAIAASETRKIADRTAELMGVKAE